MRIFESGATRDTSDGKLNYVKALSPIVLKRYVEYLGQHRQQADGGLRDWDNWKQGIPIDTYLDSLGRHFWAVWMLNHGYSVNDNHGQVDIESSLCGVIFNSMGMLYELLKQKQKITKIYLDMDGVLTNFRGEINRIFEIKEPAGVFQENWYWWRDYGVTDSRVEAVCGERFWEELNWTNDGLDIFHTLCSDYENVDIYFLSVPMKNKISAQKGKTLWLSDRFSDSPHKLLHWDAPIISTLPKSLFARPDTLLIDDTDKNVEDFREAGGKAILIARPWNSRWQDSGRAFELFKKELAELS
jgi:FMN phosphatase YigB (HAD superfamily)